MKKALEKIASRLELAYKLFPGYRDEYVKIVEFNGVGIPVKFDTLELHGLTGSWKGGVASQRHGIVVEGDIFKSLGDRFARFVIAHEMGHVLNEHTLGLRFKHFAKIVIARFSPALRKRWTNQIVCLYKNERAADEFAIKLLGLTKEEYSEFRAGSTDPVYAKVRDDILATMA